MSRNIDEWRKNRYKVFNEKIDYFKNHEKYKWLRKYADEAIVWNEGFGRKLNMARLTEKITDKQTGKVLAYGIGSSGRIKAYRKLGEIEDLEEQLQKYTTIDAISALKGLLSQYQVDEEIKKKKEKKESRGNYGK